MDQAFIYKKNNKQDESNWSMSQREKEKLYQESEISFAFCVCMKVPHIKQSWQSSGSGLKQRTAALSSDSGLLTCLLGFAGFCWVLSGSLMGSNT